MSHPTYVISLSPPAKLYVLIWFKYSLPHNPWPAGVGGPWNPESHWISSTLNHTIHQSRDGLSTLLESFSGVGIASFPMLISLTRHVILITEFYKWFFMIYFRNETKSTSENSDADCMSRVWCWSILPNWWLWSKSFTWFSKRKKAFWLLHPSRIRRFLFNACCSLYWNYCNKRLASEKFYATQINSCTDNRHFSRIQH